MQDVEIILRFYSLYNFKFLKYNEPMKFWLDGAMNKGIAPSDFYDFEILFKKTMEKILFVFGESAFKKEGRVFNRAIFDAISIAISLGLEQDKLADNLLDNYQDLLKNPEFLDSIREGTTGKGVLKKRIKLALDKLTKIETQSLFGEKNV